MKILLLLAFFTSIFFNRGICQYKQIIGNWYPYEYFIGEGGERLQKIVFMDNCRVILFKESNLNTKTSEKFIKRNTNFDVSDMYVKIIPGKAIIEKNVNVECWVYDQELNDTLTLTKGDTVNYIGYCGEGIHLIRKNNSITEIDQFYHTSIEVISSGKIKEHSIYLKKFSGWIRKEDYQLELKYSIGKQY